jgi:putative effector of murein hydrolase
MRLPFLQMLRLYTVGKSKSAAAGAAAGLTLPVLGAGDVLLFLLGPAVVSLAISMYERRLLMRQNLAEVGTALAVSTTGGLFGTALIVKWLNIASPYLRLSLLSRNITSPLAMAIAAILGADVSLAVSMVVVTGLIGANFGANILDACSIRDPVARGLSVGAAAHGLGTAALSNEQDAFPFAAISMALTATAATVAVSIPVVKKCLIQLALGV